MTLLYISHWIKKMTHHLKNKNNSNFLLIINFFNRIMKIDKIIKYLFNKNL